MVPSKDLQALKAEQRRLAQLVIQKEEQKLDLPNIRIITGIDVAYSGSTGIAGAVTLEAHTNNILEMKTAIMEVYFPYIPTFLSYRELPPLIRVFKRLTQYTDIFMIDGHGIAHPRGLGLASHFGIEVNQPTIGVAKKLLVGEPEFCPECSGEWAKLIYQGKPIGAILRSRQNGKPIFISVGHLISLSKAIEIVKLVLSPQQRIPEPLRLADHLTRRQKREFELKKGNHKMEGLLDL